MYGYVYIWGNIGTQSARYHHPPLPLLKSSTNINICCNGFSIHSLSHTKHSLPKRFCRLIICFVYESRTIDCNTSQSLRESTSDRVSVFACVYVCVCISEKACCWNRNLLIHNTLLPHIIQKTVYTWVASHPPTPLPHLISCKWPMIECLCLTD